MKPAQKARAAAATFLSIALSASEVVAQRRDPGAEAAATACAGGCGLVLVAVGVYFVLSIALLIWVARDAKARGMDSAVVWMLLVMFTSVIGLIIYLMARPQGNVVRCQHCGNSRLQASAKCPHCSNA
jgi:hypothetical protein